MLRRVATNMTELTILLESYLKMTPIFIYVILGVIAGLLKIEKQTLMKIVIFILTPIVFFNIGLQSNVSVRYLLLPCVVFFTSTTMCFLYLWISKKILADKKSNLMAFAAGTSNSAYFGLPLVYIFFDKEIISAYMLAIIGMSFYEYTVGIYIMARSDYNVKKSIQDVIKLPIIPSFVLGILCHRLNLSIPLIIDDFFDSVQACYMILGLMMIGASLLDIRNTKIDWRFVFLLFSARFITSPVLTLFFVLLDLNWLHLFSQQIDHAMLMLSFMPPAVSTIIFANMYRHDDKDASVSVMGGMLLAMVMMPVLFFCLHKYS